MNNIFQKIFRNHLETPFRNHEFCFLKGSMLDVGYKDLMPWDKLNSILSEHRLTHPRLRLVQDGNDIPQDVYTHVEVRRRQVLDRKIIPKQFYEKMNQGATLVIDAIDELHDPLKCFINSIEREFKLNVQANLYLSTKKIKGFATHWDDHDVLIFQVHGKKNWYLYGETRKYPMFRDFQEPYNPPQEPLWSEVLEEGDILYIPRGVWHDAEALDSPSLHITVGINRKTGFDFYSWLEEKLHGQEIFRKDLPLLEEEVLGNHYKLLKSALIQELENTDLREYYADTISKLKSRPTYNLPYVIETNSHESLIYSRFSFNVKAIPEIITQGDELIFKCDNREWAFNVCTSNFFDLMKDCLPHYFSEIRGCFSSAVSDEEVRGLILSLLENNILKSAQE